MGSLRKLLALAVLGAAAQAAATALFRRQRQRHAGARRHFLVTQGGLQLRPSAQELDGAVVSVMMGGVQLDLRQAAPAQRPLRLEVLALMGGVQLVVPQDWNVGIDVEAAMGGVRDGRAPGAVSGALPDLLVSGRVVMGGLEVTDRPSPAPGSLSRARRPRS